MSDDAAAAARRIVEEVLARHGQGEAPATDTVATPTPAGPADEAAVEPTPPDPNGLVDAPAQGDRPDAETELLAAAGEAASAASRIARRIVAEALAEADQQHAQESAGGGQGPQPEASVSGVPAEGLPVEDEQTVGIEVPKKPTDTDDPPARGPAPQMAIAAETPEPDPGSAAEIVRRIVADVQAEAFQSADESSPSADESSPSAEEPSGPAEKPGTSADEHDRSDVGAATSPEQDDASPGGAHGPEPDTTARLAEQRPETATAALPQHHSVAVGARPDTGFETAPAPVPTAVPGRELEGWATPLSPGPSVAKASQDSAPRTLRWLLASLLGAVALAVLFPLAVAALRALVAMD